MKSENMSRPVALRSIKVGDVFWKQKMELVRKEVIPYQWDALNDRIPGAAPSYCMRNFKVAGDLNRRRKEQGEAYQEKIWPLDTFETLPEKKEELEERFYGFLFQDSDFSKWIEAAAYSLTQHPDAELERIADEAIDIVCAAQLENGYLDTYYIINDQSQIFSNLRDNHELYCFGHLAEGAAAYYEATGKDKLLQAAERYADYIAAYFGEEEGKCKGYPGHEVAEMALIRLYELSGNKKYLELCRFFLEQRGVRPYFFDQEHPEAIEPGKEAEMRYQYNQAHLPVKEQTEALGHAVRAVYLYSGMADYARVAGDKGMFKACQRLWDNIVGSKMYITGGIGATHMGEAFSFNYDLPNDTAYAETCASIGLVFFARRMLEIEAKGEYADVMERALYNGILSGMALDGKSFFYVNPLEVLPEACEKDERKFHVKPERQKWFGCACCPPNLSRLISAISSYAYTESEDTLFIHLYMAGVLQKKIRASEIEVKVDSQMPWSGQVSVTVNTKEPAEFTMALRVPGWNCGYSVKGADKWIEKDGYLYFTKVWEGSEIIELDFAMETRYMQADLRVRENIGKAAVVKGPLVYCMEEADNGKNLHLYMVRASEKLYVEQREIRGEAVQGIYTVGRKRSNIPGAGLYTQYCEPVYEDAKIRWIPYYAWANRGVGEMQVWTNIMP